MGMMVAGSSILNRFGWGVAALITPTVLLETGATFFSLVLAPGERPLRSGRTPLEAFSPKAFLGRDLVSGGRGAGHHAANAGRVRGRDAEPLKQGEQILPL